MQWDVSAVGVECTEAVDLLDERVADEAGVHDDERDADGTVEVEAGDGEHGECEEEDEKEDEAELDVRDDRHLATVVQHLQTHGSGE